jgi:hypothetical protein
MPCLTSLSSCFLPKIKASTKKNSWKKLVRIKKKNLDFYLKVFVKWCIAQPF